MDVDSSTETLTITRKVKYALTLSVYFCYFAYVSMSHLMNASLTSVLSGTGLQCPGAYPLGH